MTYYALVNGDDDDDDDDTDDNGHDANGGDVMPLWWSSAVANMFLDQIVF